MISGDIVTDLLGIVTALLVLATAWISYRTVSKKTRVGREASTKVLRVEDPRIRQSPWNMRRTKWLFALGALPALAFGVFGVFGVFDPIFRGMARGIAVANLLMVALLIALIAFLRTEPPSRTRRSARITLQMSMSDAMQSCLAAVSNLGAEVAKYDATEGIIVAKTGMSVRSFGEIITVKANLLGIDECQVDIESDVLQVTVLFDWGANARNIQRIKDALIGT